MLKKPYEKPHPPTWRMGFDSLDFMALSFLSYYSKVSMPKLREDVKPTSLNFSDLFPNRILAEATIDRLRHGAYTVVLEGKSYRSPRPAANASKIAGPKSPKNDTLKGGEKH